MATSKMSKMSKKGSKKSKGTKKSSKKSMPKDYAYCLICRKQTKMSDIKTKTTKNGRKQLVGMGECKHTVYRFA